MFVDYVKVKISAGNGGNGKLSFRHEKFIDRGGPDGGDGGNGGNIIFKASNNKDTLAEFRFSRLLQAQHGEPGDQRRKHGKSGKDLIVEVPQGTSVVDITTNQLIADLNELGQQVIIANGGRGGFGNAHFKSSVRQAPRIAELGEKGDSLDVVLELKMVADVGIIGLPNAGKSTFLSVVSSARPEIGDYPFTTKVPNLGVADIANGSLLIADIPGLIEGASQGKGLGHEFLRHVSRCKVLLHFIDGTTEDIASAYSTINQELISYGQDLANKPQIVALTKAELIDTDIFTMQTEQLKKIVPKGTKIMQLSSSAHLGTKELLNEAYELLTKLKLQQAELVASQPDLPVITLAPDKNKWQVTRQDDKTFLITGDKIEGFARRTDFNQPQAIVRLRDILKKMGIVGELVKMGAEPGNKLIIGDPKCGKLEY
jgi:GTP-binding protein